MRKFCLGREGATLGSFIRVPQVLYYRLDHSGNFSKHWFDWAEERKRTAWATMFTGMLEASMPACSTPEERLYFQQFIMDRILVVRPGQNWLYAANSFHSSGALIAECIQRLAHEGNMHLLDSGDLLGFLQTSARAAALQEGSAILRSKSMRIEAELAQLRSHSAWSLEMRSGKFSGSPADRAGVAVWIRNFVFPGGPDRSVGSPGGLPFLLDKSAAHDLRDLSVRHRDCQATICLRQASQGDTTSRDARNFRTPHAES
jgi:hypothetical protein